MVSTHSRPKAAGANWRNVGSYSRAFQLTAARRRLVARINAGIMRHCFNSQPPEGGWFYGLSWVEAETVEESEYIYEAIDWRYAKEIESKPRTITLSDLNSKIEDIKKIFGIEESEDVIIKID